MLSYYNFVKKIHKKIIELWNNGAFHIMIGSFLNKFISMFGSIIIVRLLSKTEYGILSYIENLYSYVYVVAGLGLSNAILRYVVLAKSKEEKYEYFEISVKYGLFINLILILFMSFINTFYSHGNIFFEAKKFLYLLVTILPLQHLIEDCLYMERANFSNKRFAYMSLLSSIILIISRIIGAFFFGLTGIVILQIVCYLLISCCFFLNTSRKYKPKKKKKTITYENKKVMSLYSFQYMVTNGLWTIFMLNDTFMLGKLAQSATVLADYRVAYVIPAALSIFSSAIGTYIAPYFVKNEKNYKWIRKNFLLTFFCTAGLIGIIILFIFLFGKYIILIIYGNTYLNIIELMNLLLIASFFNCGIRFTCANLLAAMGQIKYNMFISIIGMILQILLNYFLIPKYGSYGAATTSIIVYLYMGVSLFFIFSKKYHIFTNKS